MKKVKIAGTGMYVPEKVLTNFDLEKMVDTSDEWIRTRTGIRERRILDNPELATSDMAVEASKIALENAGMQPEDIDMVIVATITPDMVFPSTAALIQDKLEVPEAVVLDIEAACSGFIYATSIVTSMIRTGIVKNALVIGAETLSRITDWKDRSTCVLFGDGAGAAILTEAEDNEDSDFLSFVLGGDGGYRDLLYMPAGGSLLPASEETIRERLHFIKMRGQETFKAAVRKMSESLEKAIELAGVSKDDIKLVIPHQANVRITDAVAKQVKIPPEKFFINLDRYGNTSAASIPIALAEAVDEKRIKRGDIIAFVAFGGGLTWGAAILRY